MANTTLQAYIEELKFLLDREAFEEVMGHCRHILQHFPKNIEVYRLLGRALLDKDRHQEAADVFQRVLSAIPDDFVAHLGLSGIAEEAGQLPQAIWHLESAYEQEPNNAALRQEIKRLYERRDGFVPDRVPLSAGGLAQAYVKGRLYEQAISELTSALAQTPDRVDLRLKLAQVLWATDRHVEAAEAALLVVDKLPNSIEANRMMATLWLKAGRPSDAAPFISHLEQLDPFLAWATVNPEQPLPATAFALPHLDWDARTAAALGSDVPDWVNAIGTVFDAPESVSLSGGVPNWREDVPAPSTPEPKRSTGRSSLLNSRRLTETESVPSNVADDVPDWFKDMGSPSVAASTTPANDVPDWFKDVAASDKGPVETPPTPAAPPEPMEALSADWLDEADDDMPSSADILDGTDESSSGATAAPLDAMSWLTTGPLPPLEDRIETPRESQGNMAALDWMSDSAQAQTPEPASTDDQDPMAWLRPYDSDVADNADEIGEAVADASGFDFGAGLSSDLDATTTSNVVSTPVASDWLDDLDDIQLDSSSPAPVSGTESSFASSGFATELAAAEDDDDDPDAWLANFTNTENLPVAGTSAPSPASPATGLDWLSDDNAASGATSSEPNLEIEEDWLASFEGAVSGTPEVVSPTSAPSSFESPSAPSSTTSSVDDWLATTDSTAEAADDSLPDWMSQSDQVSSAGDASDWLSTMSTPTQTSSANAPQSDFDFGSLESSDEAEPVEGDAPDWLSAMAPPAQSSAGSARQGAMSLDDLDFGSLESSDEAEPVEGDAPDWLSAMAPPAQSSAGSAKQGAMSLDDLDFGSLESSDEAEPVEGDAPDWLSTMAPPAQSSAGSAKQGAMSLDDLDFGSLESSDEAEPVEGDAPDWLSAMASPAASGGAKPTAMSLDNIDFDNKPAQPMEPILGEVPDWLSAFSTEPSADASTAPSSEPASEAEPAARPRHAMPEHFPEVDFDKLALEGLPASAGSSADMDFDFGGVAQPANLMNTNRDNGAQSFTFEQKPAWMRKGKASGAGPGRNAAQSDLPEWNDAPAESGNDADDSIPDWMKE